MVFLYTSNKNGNFKKCAIAFKKYEMLQDNSNEKIEEF